MYVWSIPFRKHYSQAYIVRELSTCLASCSVIILHACSTQYSHIYVEIVFSFELPVFPAWLFPHAVKLNAGRVVTGILRGFDPYMNIVLDDTVEEKSNTQKIKIGMVVCSCMLYALLCALGLHSLLI